MTAQREWSFVSDGIGGKYRRYARDEYGDRPLYDDEWKPSAWLEVTVHGDPPGRKTFIRRVAYA